MCNSGIFLLEQGPSTSRLKISMLGLTLYKRNLFERSLLSVEARAAVTSRHDCRRARATWHSDLFYELGRHVWCIDRESVRSSLSFLPPRLPVPHFLHPLALSVSVVDRTGSAGFFANSTVLSTFFPPPVAFFSTSRAPFCRASHPSPSPVPHCPPLCHDSYLRYGFLHDALILLRCFFPHCFLSVHRSATVLFPLRSSFFFSLSVGFESFRSLMFLACFLFFLSFARSRSSYSISASHWFVSFFFLHYSFSIAGRPAWSFSAFCSFSSLLVLCNFSTVLLVPLYFSSVSVFSGFFFDICF